MGNMQRSERATGSSMDIDKILHIAPEMGVLLKNNENIVDYKSFCVNSERDCFRIGVHKYHFLSARLYRFI